MTPYFSMKEVAGPESRQSEIIELKKLQQQVHQLFERARKPTEKRIQKDHLIILFVFFEC